MLQLADYQHCLRRERDYNRSDCRGASLGDTETNLPRCWVDNLNPHGSGDNLLDNDTLKYLRLWQQVVTMQSRMKEEFTIMK